MKRPYPLLFTTAASLIAFLLMFSACGSKDSTDNGKAGANINTHQVACEDQKSYLCKGYIIADMVNVRSEPGLQSEIIDMLNIGDIVDIAGVSDTIETIGDYEARWYNIRYGDINGWCYGEYISRSDELAERLITRFRHFLADPVEIADAVAVLKKFIRLSEDECVVDNCIREIIKLQERMSYYYQSVLYEIAKTPDIIEQWSNSDLITDPELKEKIAAFKENGYVVFRAEGDIHIQPDPSFLLKHFRPYVSQSLEKFLTLMVEETHRHALNDAGLVITWNQLSDRIAAWEEYIREYPDSLEAGKALQAYTRYLHVYVYGIDNTPLCEISTDKVKSEVIESYVRFIDKYEDTSTGTHKIIKEYYEILRENNFTLNDRVLEHINAQVPSGRK